MYTGGEYHIIKEDMIRMKGQRNSMHCLVWAVLCCLFPQFVWGLEIHWLPTGVVPVGNTQMESYAMPRYSEGLLLVTMEVEGQARCGYLNKEGEFVVQPTFLEGRPFSQGLAAVKMVVSRAEADRRVADYLHINDYHSGEGDWVERYGFINQKGEMVIAPSFRDAYGFSQDLVAVELTEGEWGYLHLNNSLAVLGQYDWADDFVGDYAIVQQEGYYGVIRQDGSLALPLDFSSIGGGDGIFSVKLDQKYAIASPEGGILKEAAYDSVGYFSEGYAMVEVDGLWGYVNQGGNQIIAPQYRQAFHFSEGYAWVRQGSTYSFVDCNGVVLLQNPHSVSQVTSFSEGYARGKYGIYYGFFDKTGDLVIPFQYRDAAPVSEGVGLVYNGSNWGLFYPETKIDGWGQSYLTKALNLDLIPSSLYGKDYTQALNRTQFTQLAMSLFTQLSLRINPDWDWKGIDMGRFPFSDTLDESVLMAFDLGVVNGVSEGVFGAYDPINREQAAVLLAALYEKATGVTAPTLSPVPYQDRDDISNWASSSVDFLSHMGIVSGAGDNKFNPLHDITGQEAVIMALNLLER